MSMRPAAVASLALAMLPTPAVRNAAVTTRYRIETKNETTVDLSGFGAPSQQQNFTLVSWIAVTVSDTTGGRTVHLVVDSMSYNGNIPVLSQATVDSAKGGTVHGFVDQNGRVSNLTSNPQNVFLAEVQGFVYSLFPRVKAGAKAGDGWSDTVEVTSNANGANVKSRFLIDYTSAGQETVAGLPAVKLSSVNHASVTGTLENPQMGSMEVEGKVSGASTIMLAPDGRYLGGTSNSTSDQMLKSAMVPGLIPVKTLRTTTVTLIR